MGRRAQPKKNNKKEESSSQEEEELDDEPQDLDEVEEFAQEEEDHSILLKQIEDKIAGSEDDGLKLTWNAILHLKEQEAKLNDQLYEQEKRLKDKYELLKQPIYTKISSAVSGIKVEKELYNSGQLVKNININKTKPEKIEEFWISVLSASGLISAQFDFDCFEKCTFLQCELVELKRSQYKIVAKFADNSYIKNKELTLDIAGPQQTAQDKGPTEKDYTRKVNQKIEYKGAKSEQSFITQLFDEQSKVEVAYASAVELYRAYSNSLFFYFHSFEEEGDGEGNDPEHAVDVDQDDDDEEEEEEKKPQKKRKAEPIQKPQCKQQ